MKKVIIISIIAMSLVLFGIYEINRKNNIGKEKDISNEETTKISEVVEDECTEEWNELERKEKIEVNYAEEKVSPNCFITLKRNYTKCNHTVNEYIEVPEKLVNRTEEEVEKEYKDWKIEYFTSNKIILQKECDDFCGQHYILREQEGKIVIYRVDENNNETLYEITDISTQYLTEKDKNEIKQGERIYGKEKLDQIIEDFE